MMAQDPVCEWNQAPADPGGRRRWAPGLSCREIRSRPLPGLGRDWPARWALRAILRLFRGFLADVEGAEHIAPGRDPFILALNHNQRLEAVLVPVYMIYVRQGRKIHFLSDWNFQLIPGLAFVLRHAEVITLVQKPARPQFLNVLKARFHDPVPAFKRAQIKLAQGASVGVFPEGTVNRDPQRLLRGHLGTARLSVTTGIPVVPAGIRFPDHPPDRPIPDWTRMTVRIGPPISPRAADPRPPMTEVRDWHARIMGELARLSGKSWSPSSPHQHDDS